LWYQPIRVPTQDFKKEKKKKGPLVALPIIHFAANHGSNPGFQKRKKKDPLMALPIHFLH
jgi:hypothetical protein